MAEIPISRKPAIPLWGWFLLAAGVVILLWWALAGWGRRDTVAIGNPAEAEPITDVVAIVAIPNRLPLVGRRVQFTNVNVQSVVGDKTFWIGPSAEQRVFVVLNEVPTPGTPIEGRYDINAGQTINVTGTLVRMPDANTAKDLWGEPGGNASASEQVYLFAQKAEILSSSAAKQAY